MAEQLDRLRPDTTRISITFSNKSTKWLMQEANNRGISIAEVVRRIIDEVRHDYIVSRDTDQSSERAEHAR